MVLPLKRWKSRTSPGIKAGGYGLNPFTCQSFGSALEGPLKALFVILDLVSADLRPIWGDIGDAGWSSPVARQAHNLKVVGSNPTPATTTNIQPASPSLAGPLLFGAYALVTPRLHDATVGRQRHRGHHLAPKCNADCRLKAFFGPLGRAVQFQARLIERALFQRS